HTCTPLQRFYSRTTARVRIPPLSLHDALPIFGDVRGSLLGKGFAGLQALGEPLHEQRGSEAQRAQRTSLDILGDGVWPAEAQVEDRKSTRLNSSHVKISYAVFCLKKKRE